MILQSERQINQEGEGFTMIFNYGGTFAIRLAQFSGPVVLQILRETLA